MRGPGISPFSTRSLSTTVLARLEAVSTTVVKPKRFSMSVIAAASSGASFAAASANFASVKWTWLFWKPAVTVPPSQPASRRAPRSGMSFAGPAAAIFPSTIRIAASSMGAASGDT